MRSLALLLIMMFASAPGQAQAPGVLPLPSPAETFTDYGPSTLPTSGGGEYRVGPDDLLEVTVFEVPELGAVTRVTATGSISIPLLGPVPAAGLTPQELARKIEEALRAKYVKNPSVTVFVREYASQPVSLIGAVRSPGIYQIKGQKYLLDMLAMAQGLTAEAGSTIQVIRRRSLNPAEAAGAPAAPPAPETVTINVEDLFERGQAELNVPIYAGDVINVLQAGSIFVVGELNRPSQYVLRNGRSITVTQAVALGGGFTNDAKKSDCTIIRVFQDGTKEEIVVDVDEILKGEAVDVTMLPNDILFVPASRTKAALRRTLEATIGVVTGRAIYGF